MLTVIAVIASATCFYARPDSQPYSSTYRQDHSPSCITELLPKQVLLQHHAQECIYLTVEGRRMLNE